MPTAENDRTAPLVFNATLVSAVDVPAEGALVRFAVPVNSALTEWNGMMAVIDETPEIGLEFALGEKTAKIWAMTTEVQALAEGLDRVTVTVVTIVEMGE
jgi:hypothetical protein